MSAGFSPGPWNFGFEPYDDGIPYVRISAGDGGMFDEATEQGFNLSGITSEADGRLIAAAPALHKAADLLASFDATGDEAFLRDAIRAAREALAIVRGEQ
jgi:hypothetical protein